MVYDMDFSKITSLPFIPNKHRVRLALSSAKERLLGLDFTLPDRMYDRNRKDGAMYYATPPSALKQLFETIDPAFDSFIDIGCGKGYVLYKAKKFGFAKVGGIEYDAKLTDICRKNMRRLKMDDSVNVTCTDARTFEHYNDYNVFYFFNPFVEDVMESVISSIVKQCPGKEVTIVYYRPRYPKPIESRPYFVKQAELYDSINGYTANVYRGVIPG